MHQLFVEEHFCSGGSDVWINEPTYKGIIIYSVIVPIISFSAICGNALSLVVLLRKEFKSSIYTYLSVLAATDLIDSTILFIAGLCRGVLWHMPGWREYEALIGLPLGGAVSSVAVIATVAVALDRVVYLWNPTRCMKPRFCKRRMARRIMLGACSLSILFNIPYCFMFEWTKDGRLQTSYFFDTSFYAVHNWIKFILFGIIPAILLIFGNGFLIYCLKYALKLQEKCKKRCNMSSNSIRKTRDQRYVTLTLIAIVFLFLVGEFPTHLASRKTAVTILFGGNQEQADKSVALETFRQIATVLNAINIAANFFIYCVFCPLFRRSLSKMFTKKGRKNNPKNLQVNVFVVNGKTLEENGFGFNIPKFSNTNFFGWLALNEKHLVSSKTHFTN